MKNITLRNYLETNNSGIDNSKFTFKQKVICSILNILDNDGIKAEVELLQASENKIQSVINCNDQNFRELIRASIGLYTNDYN